MKNKIYKDTLLILIMGFIYMGIEIVWRFEVHISMIFVGGLCSFLVGKLNENPKFYDRKIWQQCLIGTGITLIVEFLSGMILNVWLELNIWDYSDVRFNLCGQICFTYSIFWFLLMPLCIFVDDWLRYKLFDEEKPNGLMSNYKDLIRNK